MPVELLDSRIVVGESFQRDARELFVLGEFRCVVDGREVDLPPSSQRLLAHLAVVGRSLTRRQLAITLWPDLPEARALARVRSALFHVRRDSDGVDVLGHRLGLSGRVRVDFPRALALARLALAEQTLPDPAVLFDELLPGWDDYWAVVERERFNRLRVQALEAQCASSSRAGHHGAAVIAGRAAVDAAPYREGAHRALVAAHLAECNPIDAVRQYRAYRDLAAELGLRPSSRMDELVAGLLIVPRPRTQRA